MSDLTIDQRLGSDLKFPINGSIEVSSGTAVVIQDIEQLLLTVPGERVNRPDFGCNLRNQIWENIDDAATEGAASIEEALDRYEPRITLLNVDFEVNRNTDLITYNIQFNINANNTQVNLVFPFRVGTQLSFQ